MNDSEQLVQRFLDQELSAEERVRFISRLGRDEALRQRTLELEQLLLGVDQLPRPVVPDDFVARVMQRTASPQAAAPKPATSWRSLADALWTPRTFRWNLASAGATVCLALLVLGTVVIERSTPAPGRPATSPAPVAATVLVRLVVLQPNARTVQVAGDFNGWSPERTALEQISGGAWAVTIPLKPGRYEYMFVVDGKEWIADPFATEQNDDGFGSRNAVLDVRAAVGAQL
ncbi:MAG: hypothetical protein ND807_12865 [Vicinamibacterales bacterium]|nr:hypothetical protein [Vicinamibacterales bacterium]